LGRHHEFRLSMFARLAARCFLRDPFGNLVELTN
jgi:hypothetical protein